MDIYSGSHSQSIAVAASASVCQSLHGSADDSTWWFVLGSHGGGTADGQAAVLAALGVSAETMGCPVRATMETVTYGEIEGGQTCHFDANAAAADGVLVINRVKAHTSFERPVESGLTKMLAVGLGKAEGARQVHVIGPRGLAESLPRLAAR